MTHEEFQEEIPAYIAGTIEVDLRLRLEAHLRSCESCSEMVTDLKGFDDSIRQGGDALFNPHPEPMELRSHALGLEPVYERIVRHLGVCDSCGLQVDAWRRQPPAVSGRKPAGHVPRGFRRLAGAAVLMAAGLVLGAVLTFWVGETGIRWSGPVQLVVFPLPTRGPGQLTRIHLRHAHSRVVLTIPFQLPDDQPADDLLRIRILKRAGAEVHALEGRASDLMDSIGETSVIAVLIPPGILEPGVYDVVIASGDRTDPPISRVPFEVSLGE